MRVPKLLKSFKPRSSSRRVVVARGSGVPPATTSSFRFSDYPRSTMAAAALGLFAMMLVAVNLPLASCESSGGRSSSDSGSQTHPVTPGVTGQPLPHNAGSPSGVANSVNLASLDGIRMEPEMRVRIREAASSISIQALRGSLKAGPLAPGLVDWSEQSPAVASQLTLTGVVKVSLSSGPSGRWSLTDASGNVHSLAASSDLGLVIGDPLAGGSLLLDGAGYPGRLRLVPRSDLGDGRFDIVEFVPLETYLPGVIAKELYPAWPLETYRVQAVCARSYALHERARARATGGWYDIHAGEQDQAYSGATNNGTATTAVTSTRGVILAWNSKVLRAYYSSTCGGRVSAAADTWPTTPGFEYNLAGPIQAVHRESACQNAPLYRWSVVRPTSELVSRIRAFGASKKYLVRQLTGLAAITPLDFNADGRPRHYKVIEPGGKWYALSAEDLRMACNTPPEGQTTSVNRDQRVNSGDVEFVFTGGPNGTVTINGRGFGHGVGMCQYCALEMAKRGDGWKTMLTRFYPGANIVRAYE